ncbi:MAG TPA: ABC transporter ATP-binding protein [Candidatus Binatia bacterium]|jgi:ABC-2 type transport system ATP-binding protein|nr:ABC transporter ATP-binding protein [Candidatus Binatia bacterium]
MDAAIETHQLSKQFKRSGRWQRLARRTPASAVSDVSLRIEKGELFGLLGPNGAGKTTLVKMLCTLVLPTRGRATVAGFPLRRAAEIRAAVGLMVTDDRSFYWRLTGRENLRFFAALHRIHGAAAHRRVDEVLEQVAMEHHADRRFSDYSTGMKQRIALARCLLHRPRILFLDEPSRSLDPVATQRLHDLLQRLIVERDVTIFLITHDLSEAEKLCSRVAVMNRGRIRIVGQPGEMRRQLTRYLQYDVLVDNLPPAAEQSLQDLVPDLNITATGEQFRLRFSLTTSAADLTRLLDCLRQNAVTIFSIESKAPSLEEVFTHFTAEQDE